MIWFRPYLNGLLVFPIFFKLSLNLAIRSSWSEPQSAPSLIFADCIDLFHLFCKEYNQSDFSIDHLVMSMCSVVSCVVGRGFLLWPVHSLGKALLAFALLHFVPPYLHPGKSVNRSRSELEPDMEQQTGYKLRKDYLKAVYYHPIYLTYMQRTSCEMPS